MYGKQFGVVKLILNENMKIEFRTEAVHKNNASKLKSVFTVKSIKLMSIKHKFVQLISFHCLVKCSTFIKHELK